MNVLVAIKIVSTTLIHAKEEYEDSFVINPYDLYALSKILEAKRNSPNIRVTCVSMGAKSCEVGLKKALMMGADVADLITDRAFSGADTIATVNVLSHYIKKNNFDVIVCGEKSIDGETGQVPYQLAQLLSLESYSKVINLSIKDECLKTEESESKKIVVYNTPLPALLIFEGIKIGYPPINFKQLKESRRKKVGILTKVDLNISKENCGILGSKTRVIKTQAPLKAKRKETLFLTSGMQENIQEICKEVLRVGGMN